MLERGSVGGKLRWKVLAKLVHVCDVLCHETSVWSVTNWVHGARHLVRGIWCTVGCLRVVHRYQRTRLFSVALMSTLVVCACGVCCYDWQCCAVSGTSVRGIAADRVT